MLSRRLIAAGRRGTNSSSLKQQQQHQRQQPLVLFQSQLDRDHNNDSSTNGNAGTALLQCQQQFRSFHSTPKQEILPVLAVGAVLVIGRYSWKALNRMDEDWEDYQWQLQQYERQRLKEEAASAPTTIGVDLGSLYLKLSTLQGNKPELVPTAQGERYRFTGILMGDGNDNDNDNGMVFGQPAQDKFFYQPSTNDKDPMEESVILPYRELQKASHEEASTLVQKIFVPAVGEAMDRLLGNDQKKTDDGVRTVLTLPPPFYNQHGETILENYHDDSHHTITVPDPVAAIWGAQTLKLIPEPETKEDNASSILVIDVGALATSVSLVRQDKVEATTTLDDIGGENFVQQLVNKVFEEADDPTLTRDQMSLALVNQSVRGSVLELLNKTSTKVHIPYLFMGRNSEQPHFESTVSRTVLEQIVQDYWKETVIPKLMETDALSASLPPPTNASSLITSAVTKVLEESEETPTNIKHILVVGGGSRHSLFERACRDGVEALMGPSPGKMVVPEASVRAELPSLGASALLPNFDYSYDRGLERA